MLITEGTQPSEDGQGYLATPGIHTAEQAEAWSRVADAVHEAGSTLVIQLMHVGRVSHVSNTSHGRAPLAPSAIAARGDMFTATGAQPMSTPREMTEADIAQTVSDFRRAARLAIDAGADGVELHGANGYLLQQFTSSNANRRTDRYGGDMAGRIRFPLEVADRGRRGDRCRPRRLPDQPWQPARRHRGDRCRGALPRADRRPRSPRPGVPARGAPGRRGAPAQHPGELARPGSCSTAPAPISTGARRTCTTDWPM